MENKFRIKNEVYTIHNIFPVTDKYHSSLPKVIEQTRESLGKDIPFAEDAGGKFFVISLNDNDYGRVYFFDLDIDKGNPKVFLVDSFSDFVNGLF